MCQVRLVLKNGTYSPRICLWKKDKSKRRQQRSEGREVVEDLSNTRVIKAIVDTSGGHENFWKLVAFLQRLADIDLPHTSFRLAEVSSAELGELLAAEDKGKVLEAVKLALGGNLSDADIAVLAGRKVQVERFRRLLDDPDYFEEERVRLGKKPEALWQAFFEEANWIFGYGLSLVSHASLDPAKLEQVTTGAGVFSGAGKRADAVLRSRALVSSLLFCEIKRHDTDLLKSAPYRPPDVWVASDELVGGTAQLQKTVRKAVRGMLQQVNRLATDDGSPTGIEFATTRPRQVLVIGSTAEFANPFGVNGEMVEAFELYRRSIPDIEVLTFDELYERAKFIVRD